MPLTIIKNTDPIYEEYRFFEEHCYAGVVFFDLDGHWRGTSGHTVPDYRFTSREDAVGKIFGQEGLDSLKTLEDPS